MRKQLIVIITTTVLLVGCNSSSPSSSQEEKILPKDSVAVRDTIPVIEAQSKMISTMGKVVAERYADLSFDTALPIVQVLVKNGDHVRRGQVLARLDLFKLRNAIAQQQRAIEQAKLQIEQARLQMQDVIISQGYDPEKESLIPASVKHNADVKSGYAISKNQLAAAQHELKSGVLTAPFDGVVANVAVQAHQLAKAGEVVCRIIATGSMSVEFRVMEADLSKYPIGTGVIVVPVADSGARYQATISEINPVVDNQGAVTLRARIANASNLFDGMNVRILIEKE